MSKSIVIVSERADSTSLRTQIRLAVLTVAATGSHGTAAEVQAQVKRAAKSKAKKEALANGGNTFKVQLAQVRREVLAEVGVPMPEVSGRLTNEQIGELNRKLGLPSVKAKIASALKAAA